MQEFFERIESAFGMIKADPKWGNFMFDNQKMLGVNKLIQRFEEPFNVDAQAPKTAEKMTNQTGKLVTAEEVKAMWKRKGKLATVLGNEVHHYLEAVIANKFGRYDSHAVMTEFPDDETDPIVDRYNRIILQVNTFRESIRGRLIPVASEQIVGSTKYMVCGIIDQIFWNKKANEFQIWDWKTNEKLDLESGFMYKDPFGHISHCDYHKYSLQICMYKKMFMEATGIPIGQCYICWFSSDNPTQKLFPVKDFSREIDQMMEARAKELGLIDQGSVF